jgi:hypothetical protein
VLARRVAHCSRVKRMYDGDDGPDAAVAPGVGRPVGGAEGMVRGS